MIINDFIEQDLDNLLLELQWEVQPPPQMQEVIQANDDLDMNIDPITSDPEMANNDELDEELNELGQAELEVTE